LFGCCSFSISKHKKILVLEASVKQNHGSEKKSQEWGVFKAVKTVALLLATP
jgi:hypothetical protein